MVVLQTFPLTAVVLDALWWYWLGLLTEILMPWSLQNDLAEGGFLFLAPRKAWIL